MAKTHVCANEDILHNVSFKIKNIIILIQGFRTSDSN